MDTSAFNTELQFNFNSSTVRNLGQRRRTVKLNLVTYFRLTAACQRTFDQQRQMAQRSSSAYQNPTNTTCFYHRPNKVLNRNKDNNLLKKALKV
jgi:hypothetical protein